MREPIPYHPLLAAMVSILLLLSANLASASPIMALRPLAIFMAVTIVLWALLGLAFRSASKSALLTTIGVLAVTLTGPIIAAVPKEVWIVQPVMVTPRRLVGAIAVLMWLIIIYVAVRTRQPERTTMPLNLILLCLVVVPFLNIVFQEVAKAGSSVERRGNVEVASPIHDPDIFYIMPDAYAREDVLAEIYGYDNSKFLSKLSEMGFRVCDKSYSNYCQTQLCTTSTFNMSYLDEFTEESSNAGRYREKMYELLQHSELISRLRGSGYELISYDSGYHGTFLADANQHIALKGRSEFDGVLWSVVALPFQRLPFVNSILGIDQYSWHAKHITETLNAIPTTRESAAPVFVFAHIICPHPPFVFSADGELVRPDYSFRYNDADQIIPDLITHEQYVRDYVAQLRYFNQLLLDTVRSILAASSDPCIIIIQSDHGARSKLIWENPDPESMVETFAILNAYHVPEEIEKKLYDEISPVNTFRLVLNYCLGSDMPLLEDRSYFCTWSRPYEFTDVTELARGATDPEATVRLAPSN